MNRFLLICIFFSGALLNGQPVESEMDRQLDLSKSWSFYTDETVYLQHKCSAARARAIAQLANRFFFRAETHIERRELVLPLQIRLYGTVEDYRRVLRFSRYREAHYNPRMEIVTAHCGVSTVTLEEQLALFWLSESGLRQWQRFLLAEALPRMEQMSSFRLPIGKDATVRPVPLIQVLLSDHPLEDAERLTLAKLVNKLAAKGKLKDFLTEVYRSRMKDSTGLETLDMLFPGSVADILANREPAF